MSLLRWAQLAHVLHILTINCMIGIAGLHFFVLREAQQTRHDQSQIHHAAKHLNR